MWRYLLLSVLTYSSSFFVEAQSIDTSQIQVLLNKAQAFEEATQSDSAIWYYQQAAAQFSATPFISRSLQMTRKTVRLLIKQRTFDRAIDLTEEAIQLGEDQLDQNAPELDDLYRDMGDLFFSKRNIAKARSFYEQYLARSLPRYGLQHPEIIDTYFMIGVLDANSGALDNALFNFEKVLQASLKKYGTTHSKVARAYNGIGNIHKLRGDSDQARMFYEKALTIRKALFGETHIKLASIYNNLGLVCVSEGNHTNALIYFQKNLEINRATYGEQHPEIPKTYDNMGLAYIAKKDYPKALECHLKALTIASELYESDHPYFGKHYNNVGLAYKSLGQLDSGLLYLNKALDSQLKHAGEYHLETAKILMNIGRTYELLNDVDQSRQMYLRTLDINTRIFGSSHPNIAKAYNNIGTLFLAQTEYEEALSYFQKAITANFPSTENEASKVFLDNMNSALDKKQLLRSLKWKATALAEKTLQTDQQKNDLDLALETYQTAIALINQLRVDYLTENSQLDLIESAEKIYSAAFELCWQANQIHSDPRYFELAFFFAEQAKSMVLLDAFRLSNAQQFAKVPDSLIQKEKQLRTDIAYLQKKIGPDRKAMPDDNLSAERDQFLVSSQQYQELLKSIKEDYPQYYQLKYEQTTASISEVQDQLLDEQSVLLEYYETEQQYWVFIITKQEKWIHPIPKEAALKESLDNILTQLSQKPATQKGEELYYAFENNAFVLYQNLMAPLLNKLNPSIRHLKIIPHGSLTRVPFAVLLTEKTAGRTYSQRNGNYLFSQLPYLNEQYTINYNYSATLALQMEQLMKIEQTPPNVLAFAPFALESGHGQLADIQRGESFGPLPGSMEEIKTISQYFKGYFYLKNEADETTFKEECVKTDFNIIHLSSHSMASQDNDEGGRIYFDRQHKGSEDNILFDHEIYKLSIPAQLIVLSACETGSGQYHKGEGLISLARAFSYAGCPSLIMTLWRINDRSGAIVMSEFYKKLAKGESKNIALQRAKQAYLREQSQYSGEKLSAHPYYWASYVSLGNDWRFGQ